MAYYQNSRRPNQTHRNSDHDYDDAKRHIREAHELSERLGGMDKEVKEYFFNLPAKDLNQLLRDYGRIYSQKAESYARETFDAWKSGRTKMSGQTASRLFDLLPPRMPPRKKYDLVEGLWKRHSSKSVLYVTVGPDAETHEFVDPITAHLEKHLVPHSIPVSLEQSFKWLTSGDVGVRQKLLNHIQLRERELLTSGIEAKLPVLMDNFKKFQENMQRLIEKITIGNHYVEVAFCKEESGVEFSDTRPDCHTKAPKKEPRRGWLRRIFD